MMRLVLIYFICILSFSALSGQGIDFFHGTWAEALDKAKAEKKLIFVDAYAKWCGPCKRMAKSVFTADAVGKFYNENFINLKLDMEESESSDFKKFFSVSAYPTLFYIDENGEQIKKVTGGRAAADFIKMGQVVVNSIDRSGSFAEKHQKGDRSFDLVIEYVMALNKAKKPSQKIANEFLRENPELTEEQKASILYESLLNADSRIFDLFIENKQLIVNKYSKEKVEEKIEAACWATVSNAVDYEVDDLLKEAKEKCKDYLPKKYKSFAMESDYEYYKGIDDGPKMSESAMVMAKKLHKNNPEMLHHLSEELMIQAGDETNMLETAEKISKMTLSKDKDNKDYMLSYARILYNNNKVEEALKYAEKALKLCTENNLPSTDVERLINELKSI